MANDRDPAGTPGTFRAVTFNVRYDDVSRDGARRREHAREVAETIRTADADLLCLQEVISLRGRRVAEENFLRRRLEEELPQWTGIFPPGPSQLAEAGPVFLRRGRFLIEERGIFWFSETPEVPDSAHWGNALPRFCFWLLLAEEGSGRRLLAANVHLDHRSGRSRLKAVRLLQERLPGLAPGVPSLIAGDFNTGRRSRVQRQLMCSHRRALEGRRATHLFPLRRQIDQIFLSPAIRVARSFVLGGGAGGYTDHRPLAADIVLPERGSEAEKDGRPEEAQGVRREQEGCSGLEGE